MGKFEVKRVKEGLEIKKLEKFEDYEEFYYNLIDDLEPFGIYIELSYQDGRMYLIDTETKKVYGGEHGYLNLIMHLFLNADDVMFQYICDLKEFLEGEEELKEVYNYLI